MIVSCVCYPSSDCYSERAKRGHLRNAVVRQGQGAETLHLGDFAECLDCIVVELQNTQAGQSLEARKRPNPVVVEPQSRMCQNNGTWVIESLLCE